jgi:hypothetical protein
MPIPIAITTPIEVHVAPILARIPDFHSAARRPAIKMRYPRRYIPVHFMMSLLSDTFFDVVDINVSLLPEIGANCLFLSDKALLFHGGSIGQDSLVATHLVLRLSSRNDRRILKAAFKFQKRKLTATWSFYPSAHN